MSRKGKFLYIFLGLSMSIALFIGLYGYVFDEKLDQNGDNISYFLLGKALAASEGYVNLNDIQNRANNHYPPGYPALISLIIRVAGDSVIAVKMVNGAFFLLALAALFLLTHKVTSSLATATIVAGLALVNGHLLRYSTIMMSEIPFLFFSLTAILFFLNIDYTKPAWKDKYVYLTLLAITIAFYIKSSGVVLVASVLLWLIVKKRNKQALVIGLGFLLLVTPWQIRSSRLGGNSYVKQVAMVNPYRPELGNAVFTDYLLRAQNNLQRYVTKEIPLVLYSPKIADYNKAPSLINWLIGLVVLGLIGYGIYTLRNYRLFFLLYLAGSAILLLLWPDVWPGTRFILPTVVFLILAIVLALQEFLRHSITPKGYKIAQWIPLLLIIPFLAGLKPLHEQAKQPLSANLINYFSLARWVDQNLPHDVVIACRKPTTFALYANCYTVNYKYTANNQELIDDLANKGVDYVVLDQLGYSSTFRYLVPAVQANPDKFKVVQKRTVPDTYLLQLIH